MRDLYSKARSVLVLCRPVDLSDECAARAATCNDECCSGCTRTVAGLCERTREREQREENATHKCTECANEETGEIHLLIQTAKRGQDKGVNNSYTIVASPRIAHCRADR